MRSLYILISVLSLAVATPTPIVLWHGMGDTCCQIFSLRAFQVYLKKQLPNVYTLSLKVGNNTIEDLENGFFMHPNKQVDYVCDLLKKDDNLKQGFNVIGFSQGSQFSRAVIQRCGHQLPPIKSFISLGGQHQGVYGIPHCSFFSPSTCKYMSSLLNHAAYLRWVQESLVQATYWHDPLNEAMYKTGSTFLADINNEMHINKTYINNLSRIQKFVMVKFTNDSIVSPIGTEWFGFYAPGQADKLLPLQKMAIYKEDRLGLKKMDQNGKLVFLECPGDHLHLTNEWLNKNLIPYLKN